MTIAPGLVHGTIEGATHIQTPSQAKYGLGGRFALGGRIMGRVIIATWGLCLVLALAGCSVGMALSGKKEPDLGVIRIGSTRGEVELQLGSPIESVTRPDGLRSDVYEYEIGNEPSAGRAAGHAVMDIFTLGLWEVIGTPIEAVQGEEFRVTILYSPDDRVVSINRAPKSPPSSAEGDAASEVSELRPEKTAGTCFAVRPDGVLLTAYHVIHNAKSIRVYLADGTLAEAKPQTLNVANDLAILRIDIPTPNFLALAPEDSYNLGDYVFTMGYPIADVLGHEPRFTEGSISALSGFGGEARVMQISVPIQPGNSGSPLVNEQGHVVGIVTSTTAVQTFLSVTGTLPQNVNWAVKAHYARPLFFIPTEEIITASREDAIDRVRRAICLVEGNLN